MATEQIRPTAPRASIPTLLTLADRFRQPPPPSRLRRLLTFCHRHDQAGNPGRRGG